MPPVEFETTISAGERPQTYVLDRAVIGIGHKALSGGYDYNIPLNRDWFLAVHSAQVQLHAWQNNYFLLQS